MKIGVVGAGGAGGYFAGRWCEAGLDVTVIARGAHLDVVSRQGLRILSPYGDVTVSPKVTDDPAALAAAEFVLFATKTWQLSVAAEQAGPHLGNAIVCGIQNGISTAEELSRHVRPDDVLGATCRIISFIEEPGVIRHVGVEPTIVVGELSGGLSDRVTNLSEMLSRDGAVRVVASPDIVADLWKKFLFFAPVSGVSSVTGFAIGQLREDAEARRLLRSAMEELAAVAGACGVPLASNAVELTMTFVDTLPPDGTSSMQRDVAAGRPTELDALSGTVSRLGSELGVPTPTHDLIVERVTSGDLGGTSRRKAT